MLAVINKIKELIKLYTQEHYNCVLMSELFDRGFCAGKIEAYKTTINLLSNMIPKYNIDQIVYRIDTFATYNEQKQIERKTKIIECKIVDYQIRITKDKQEITYEIQDSEQTAWTIKHHEKYLYATKEEAEKQLIELDKQYIEELTKKQNEENLPCTLIEET